MVYHFYFDGLGSFTPYPSFKQIAPLVLAGLVAGAGSAIAGGANAVSTSVANKRNIDNQNALWNKQKAFQNFLNANGALIQKQSMLRAGLNPNAELGTYANLTAPSPSKSDVTPVNFDFLSSSGADVAKMIQQQPIVDATARKENALAKEQEILNQRLLSEDSVYHNDDVISNPSVDENGNSISELVKSPVNKGTYDALRALNQYKGEISDISAKVAYNRLQEEVFKNQFQDKTVVNALTRMPFREFRKLYWETQDLIEDLNLKKSQISLNDSQTALNNLEEEITRNSNIHELITKYLGDGAVADFAHVMVILLGSLTGNMRLGANVSKFSGKN